MLRLFVTAALLSAAASAQSKRDEPKWLNDRASFCSELARRTNGANGLALKNIRSITFDQYKVQPIATLRTDQAIVAKDAAFDRRRLAEEIKLAAKKGPDFAARYVIVQWTCGSWCANSVIADVRTGKQYVPPFAGVVGCERITGEHETIERRADSRLIIVRGRLETSDGDGPCGTFYYVWQRNRAQVVGCELSGE